MTMIYSPLEQFDVTPVWSIALGDTFALTNTGFFGFIVMFAIFGVLSFGTTNATIVPNRWQTLVEGVFEFVLTMAKDTVAGGKAEKYFPYLFVTFFTVAMSNLIGMIPYSFTITSICMDSFSMYLLKRCYQLTLITSFIFLSKNKKLTFISFL